MTSSKHNSDTANPLLRSQPFRCAFRTSPITSVGDVAKEVGSKGHSLVLADPVHVKPSVKNPHRLRLNPISLYNAEPWRNDVETAIKVEGTLHKLNGDDVQAHVPGMPRQTRARPHDRSGR